MATMILALTIIYLILVIVLRLAIPGNAITPWIIPQFLSNVEYPRAVVRKAGVGWIVFSIWIATLAISLSNALPVAWTKGHLVFTVLLLALVPFTAFLLLISGICFLAVGVFTQSDVVRPRLQSIFATEPGKLDVYIRRLGLWTRVNLIVLPLAVLVPVVEAILGVKAEGPVVLLNVAFLITFIMSLWRMRAYIVKSAIAMEKSGADYFLSTLGRPSAILMVWYHSHELRKRYATLQARGSSQPATTVSGTTASHVG